MGCNGTAGAHATVLIAPAGGSITFFAEEFLCPGVDLSVRTAGARGSRGQVRTTHRFTAEVLLPLHCDTPHHAYIHSMRPCQSNRID